MTVEFEGSWVQCRFTGTSFESEDRTDFESGKYYWFMDSHGQIERCRLVWSGKKVRMTPRAKYLDTDNIISWIPDERKMHISKYMLDGDYKPEYFVKRDEWDKFLGGVI